MCDLHFPPLAVCLSLPSRLLSCVCMTLPPLTPAVWNCHPSRPSHRKEDIENCIYWHWLDLRSVRGYDVWYMARHMTPVSADFREQGACKQIAWSLLQESSMRVTELFACIDDNCRHVFFNSLIFSINCQYIGNELELIFQPCNLQCSNKWNNELKKVLRKMSFNNAWKIICKEGYGRQVMRLVSQTHVHVVRSYYLKL